jgi:hypothetical protein
MTPLGAALGAFILEHEYCGELASAVEEASLGRYTPDFAALELPRLETFGMKAVCFPAPGPFQCCAVRPAALAVFRSRSLFGLSPLAWGPQSSSMYRCSGFVPALKHDATLRYELHRQPRGAPFCYIFGEAALRASDRLHSKRYGDSAGMGTCCLAPTR